MASPEQAPGATLAALSGPGHWWRSYRLMIRWEVLTHRLMLPVIFLVQFFFGAGSVVGLSFLFEQVPRDQAFYLSTGAAIIAMITIGLVLVPQLVAQQKQKRTYTYVLSLPVPRSAIAAAGMTVWLAVGLPGMAIALVAATFWYGLSLSPTWLLIPAVILAAAVATAIGYAVAHLVPNPEIIQMVAQVLVFAIFLYSPVNFPAERLPGWLAAVHQVLPFQHIALLIRGSLAPDRVEGPLWVSFAVLLAWGAVALGLTLWALGRRK